MATGNNKRVGRRTFLKYGGGAAVSVSLAGCAGSQETGTTTDTTTNDTDSGDDGEFAVTITQGTHTGTLDPQDFTGSPARTMITALYDKLVTLDFLGNGEVIPQLATDWEFVEPTRVRLPIREGVTWHNGDTLTPEDCVYTVRRVSDSEFGGTTRRELINVETAEVVDGEHAIDIVLTEQDPIFMGRLAYSGGVVNRQWMEENDTSYIARNAMGTGAYQLEEFQPEVSAVFSRRDEYWNDDINLEEHPTEIEFLASPEASTRTSQLLAGEVDLITGVIPEDTERINNGSGVSVTDFPTDRTMMLMMRNDVEPFDSLEFRKAMNYATDAGVIIETILSGYGQQSAQVTPPSWFGNDPDLMPAGDENPYPRDLDRAQQLVEESGYGGVQFEIVGPTGRYMKDVEVLQALAGQINELPNVTAEASALDQSTWRDQITPELDPKPPIHFFGFGSAPPDASVKIGRNFTCDRRNSDFSTFCDEEIDSLYQQAQSTSDPEERQSILQEANRTLVVDKAACVPLYFQAHLYGVSDRISFTGIPQEEVYWYAITRP